MYVLTHLYTYSRRPICTICRILRLTSECRIVMLLFRCQPQCRLGGEATLIRHLQCSVVNATRYNVAKSINPRYLQIKVSTKTNK